MRFLAMRRILAMRRTLPVADEDKLRVRRNERGTACRREQRQQQCKARRHR
jgi:hypothetical protein